MLWGLTGVPTNPLESQLLTNSEYLLGYIIHPLWTTWVTCFLINLSVFLSYRQFGEGWAMFFGMLSVPIPAMLLGVAGSFMNIRVFGSEHPSYDPPSLAVMMVICFFMFCFSVPAWFGVLSANTKPMYFE